MSAILIIGIELGILILGEIRLAREIIDSAKAYYGADSGTEKGLYEVRLGTGPVYNSGSGGSASAVLSNDASFSVSWNGAQTLNSLGGFNKTNRKIETDW